MDQATHDFLADVGFEWGGDAVVQEVVHHCTMKMGNDSLVEELNGEWWCNQGVNGCVEPDLMLLASLLDLEQGDHCWVGDQVPRCSINRESNESKPVAHFKPSSYVCCKDLKVLVGTIKRVWQRFSGLAPKPTAIFGG